MGILYVIFALLLIILGLVMICKPEGFFAMTESWKHDGRADPSERYLKRTRAAGVVLVVGCAALLVMYLVRAF